MKTKKNPKLPSLTLGWCLVAALAPHHAAAQSIPAPPLKISASLTWGEVYADDPLRVRVRLTCPQASRAAALQMQQVEQGQPAGDLVLAPSIATNWQEGVLLNLYRVDTNQGRLLVLGPDQWRPYLRPLLAEPPSFDGLLTARSREWLVPDAVVGFSKGSYLLTLAWNGTSLTDTNLLPPDGVLLGQDLTFEVSTPDTDEEQATHLGRLAFQEYMAGNPAGARAYGLQALQLDPKNPDRERIQTYFVVAHAALRMNDYLGGADTFQNLMQAYPLSRPDEVIETAIGRLNFLSPKLQVPPGAETNRSGFRFQLLSLPGQRYVSYSSTNLLNWMPLSTNLGTGGWFDVIDSNSPPRNVRFYRSVWTP